MPKVTLGSRFSGMSGFLDLKKAFDDATRQMQWEKEKLSYAGQLDQQKTAASMIDTGVRYGALNPVGVPTGTPPNLADFQKPNPFAGAVGSSLATGANGDVQPAGPDVPANSAPITDTAGLNAAQSAYQNGPQTLGYRLASPQERTNYVSKGRVQQLNAQDDGLLRMWLSGKSVTDKRLGGKQPPPKNYDDAMQVLQAIHPGAQEEELQATYPEVLKLRGAPKGRMAQRSGVAGTATDLSAFRQSHGLTNESADYGITQGQ